MIWSPDGKWIAIVEGFTSIYLLPDAGGYATQIAERKNEKLTLLGWVSTYPEPVFDVGRHLFVTPAGDQIQVRQAPGTKSPIMATLNNGTEFDIMDGPQMVEGQRWWKIKLSPSEVIGWVIENADWYAMK